MEKQGKRKICFCFGVAILFAVSVCWFCMRQLQWDYKVQSLQKEVAEEVFRFHVLANSDSREDQALKMKVKERILHYMEASLPQSDKAETTKEWANSHLTEIEEIAYQTIVDEGFDYGVQVEVTECYFPEKQYGDVILPKGEYEALRVEIGEARGKNWWCVLYPNLCFFDTVRAVVPEKGKEELKEVLEDEAYDLITGKIRMKIKWFFFP